MYDVYICSSMTIYSVLLCARSLFSSFFTACRKASFASVVYVLRQIRPSVCLSVTLRYWAKPGNAERYGLHRKRSSVSVVF